MTSRNEQTTGNNSAAASDWKELKFTCQQCGSHELQKCLGGRIGCAEVESIRYKPEEYEADHDEAEDVEIADAEVSVESRPDGSEAWCWGVDNPDDACSWFRCPECCCELTFEDGSLVEDDTDLARWLILADKRSQ